jgi:gluconate 2-dehydrogenase gamma chain
MTKKDSDVCGNRGRVSRREFVIALQGGAAVFIPAQDLASSIKTGLRVLPVLSPPLPVVYRLQFFTRREAAVVEAISARIIPADGRPGAKEARVVNYIDHMLSTVYDFQQSTYRQAVRRLNELAIRRYRRSFDRLSAAKQDLLLSQMERGKIPDWNEASSFFSMIRTHTVEGMFADPKYHGNAGGVGWKLLGSG